MKRGQAGTWSIYRRVVASTLLAIGTALGALFFTMDYWVDREVQEHMDSVLQERGRTLERLLPVSLSLGADGRWHAAPVGYDLDVEFFSLYDSEGSLIRQSIRNGKRSLPRPAAQVSGPTYYDVLLPDDRSGRAVAMPISIGANSAHERAILIVANDREGWDAAETRIHSALLLAMVVITAMASFLSIIIIRRTFFVLRRTAVQLARLDVDTPLGPIGDHFPIELAPFASAFNTGVRRLYDAIERERRFASNVAHELRTPLAEIHLSSESALTSGSSRRHHDALVDTIASTERMQRSIDTLLQLARLESGQEAPQRDPLDLDRAIEEAATLAGHGIRAARIIVTGRATAWIYADLAILERILANLFSNALEYTTGEGAVLCHSDAREDGLWLQVSNPAVGMAADDVRKFGQRFWRRQSEGGTSRHAGLGLALSLGLAQAHDLQLIFSLHDDRVTAELGPLQML